MGLLLCGAFAEISRRPGVVVVILAGNSCLHLVLDAIETKWGDGVHLFAPFSWELMNQGIMWPESIPIYIFSVLGLTLVIWAIRSPSPRSPRMRRFQQ
jgi:hypothetical protein